MDYQGKKDRLEEVIGLSEDPELWNDPKRAQEIGKERKILEGIVLTLDNIASGIEDNRMLIEMAVEENDEEGFAAVQEDVAGLEKQMADLEFKRMFNQPADPNNCFIDITAGAGGTEAEDWAGMLFRMYSRYAERKGFKIEILEEDDGEIAGINRATIRVEGEYAYGLLRTETGVHRLVRYSPFDSNNKRHTSFSSVFVYPEIDDSIEIEINPPICVSTPTVHQARAVSTSTKPIPLCVLPTSRRELWCNVKTTVRNTPTKPLRWKC